MESLRDLAVYASSRDRRDGPVRVRQRRHERSPCSRSRSRTGTKFTVFHISDRLRVKGWQVPAYTMPEERHRRRRAARGRPGGVQPGSRRCARGGHRCRGGLLRGQPAGDRAHRLRVRPLTPIRTRKNARDRSPSDDIAAYSGVDRTREPSGVLAATTFEGAADRVGFMVGSACFALGSFPLYFEHIDARIVAMTFFVGSIFFTAATAGARPAHRRDEAIRRSHRGTGPHLVAGVVLGCRAARLLGGARPVRRHDLLQRQHRLRHRCRTRSGSEINRLVWRPDVYGSIAFLAASYLADVAVTRRVWRWQAGSRPGWIAKLNLLGSVAFGLSATSGLHAAHDRRGRQHPPRQSRHLRRRGVLLRRRRPPPPRARPTPKVARNVRHRRDSGHFAGFGVIARLERSRSRHRRAMSRSTVVGSEPAPSAIAAPISSWSW